MSRHLSCSCVPASKSAFLLTWNKWLFSTTGLAHSCISIFQSHFHIFTPIPFLISPESINILSVKILKLMLSLWFLWGMIWVECTDASGGQKLFTVFCFVVLSLFFVLGLNLFVVCFAFHHGRSYWICWSQIN